MQFSAMSLCCKTNVNTHLSVTGPGAAAVNVQSTVVLALRITEKINQKVNAMSVAGLKYGHENLDPRGRIQMKKGMNGKIKQTVP
jgi:hypothetical protein